MNNFKFGFKKKILSYAVLLGLSMYSSFTFGKYSFCNPIEIDFNLFGKNISYTNKLAEKYDTIDHLVVNKSSEKLTLTKMPLEEGYSILRHLALNSPYEQNWVISPKEEEWRQNSRSQEIKFFEDGWSTETCIINLLGDFYDRENLISVHIHPSDDVIENLTESDERVSKIKENIDLKKRIEDILEDSKLPISADEILKSYYTLLSIFEDSYNSVCSPTDLSTMIYSSETLLSLKIEKNMEYQIVSEYGITSMRFTELGKNRIKDGSFNKILDPKIEVDKYLDATIIESENFRYVFTPFKKEYKPDAKLPIYYAELK